MPGKIPALVASGLMALAAWSGLWACSPPETSDTRPQIIPKAGSMHTATTIRDSEVTTPAIDKAAPQTFDTATFGLGWFWGVEAQFGAIEGVIRTRAGYAGGQMDHPTYSHMGDHTEAVQVDFDPQRISYEDLLAFFWDSHRPASQSFRRQYWHAIFFHDETQQKLALSTRDRVAQKLDLPMRTEVLPLRSFTRAEDYHQKYLLKRHKSYHKALKTVYPHHRDLVDSTAAARLNGYLGGYGSPEQLEREIDLLGLTPDSQALLRQRVDRKGRRP